MTKEVAKQQELTKEQAALMAQYQIDLDLWRAGRRRIMVGLVGCLAIQVPLWWLSLIAAAATKATEAWAGFFSIAMFGAAGVFGIIVIVATTTLLFDTPPRRPSIME